MSPDDDHKLAGPGSASMITWFSPQRPVENGTVFVRPEPKTVAQRDTDSEISTEQ